MTHVLHSSKLNMPGKHSTPLYQHAELGSLPAHQFMDYETIVWIAHNLREYKFGNPESSLIREEKQLASYHPISTLVPHADYFLESRVAAGIHGIRHITRVGLFSFWISTITGIRWDLLKLAAYFHDLRRQNDGRDRGHGARAAFYFRSSLKATGDSLTKEESDMVAAMIKYHEIDYNEIPHGVIENYGRGIDAFKAADAMDRIRLPNRKWWPQTSRIMLSEAHPFLPAAAAVTLLHELMCIKGMTTAAALTESVNIINDAQARSASLTEVAALIVLRQ